MSLPADKAELPVITLGTLMNMRLPREAENYRITIRIQNPGGLTAHQTVDADHAQFGFDWEARQLVITPRHMLTTLSPEQLAELSASARAGQSWHAYQAHKKHAAETAAATQIIAGLREELAASHRRLLEFAEMAPLAEIANKAVIAGLRAENERLSKSLGVARDCILKDREALYSTHFDYAVGRVNDDLGQGGLDEYDAVLGQIDAALQGSKPDASAIRAAT